MSNFFKRLTVRNQESVEDRTQDGKKKDKNVQCIDLSSSSCDEGLSLFSGMTFSSPSSSSVNEKDATTAQNRKPPSKELEESGLDLSFKQPQIQKHEVPTVQPKPTLEENINRTEKQDHEPSELRQLSYSSVQQSKRKKRSQTKRPGYARESKTTSSYQQDPVKPAVSEQQQNQLKESKKTPSTLDDTILSAQETKENSPEDRIKLRTKEKEIIPEAHEEELLVDTLSKNIPEEGSKIAVQTEKEYERKDNCQILYSIGTPSSSEENLTKAEEEEQEENKQLQRETTTVEESSDNVQDITEDDIQISSENGDDDKLVHFEQDTKDGLVLNPQPEPQSSQEKLNNTENVDDGSTELKENPVKGECSAVEDDSKEREIKNSYDLKLDAGDQFILVEQNKQFRISSLSSDENILTELKKYLMENYSNSQKTYLEKQKELDKLTEEESKALANDNYDLAEELSVKIELAKDDLENAKYAFPGEDNKVQEAIKLASDLAFRSLSIHREAQSSLEVLKEKQVVVLDNYNEACNSRTSREKQKLTTESQRLDRARAHLQLDIEHIEKEEMLIQDEISERTEEFTSQMKCLNLEREQLKEEISDLEQRLLQLRLKESQCSEEIKAQELKIEEVVEEFLPQRIPLSDQRIDLENQQLLLDEQQEKLASAQEALNKSVEECEERKKRLSDFLDNLQSSLDSNDMSISLLEKKCGEMEEFHCLKHLSLNTDAALDKLKISAKRSNQQIKNLKSKINLSNRNITSLRKRLTEIEAQIADINEAKDIAKKERNFKEAKRLKEESEVLSSEGVRSQEKLENSLEELNNDTCLLKNAETDFEKIQDELKEKEYEADLKLVKSAVQVVKGLETQLPRYKENEMLHTLLTAEISTCQNLIKELTVKHGIHNPDLEGVTECQESHPESLCESSQEKYIETVDQKDNTEQCLNTKDDTKDLEVLLDELEEKLEAVVEVEDFDEAEHIQQQIDELKLRLK